MPVEPAAVRCGSPRVADRKGANMTYNYTTRRNLTAEAIDLARSILAGDKAETADGAARRAVAVMRHGDKVDVTAVVRALVTTSKPA